MPRVDELKRQIAQLDELIRDGVLSGEPARQSRTRLEDELLALVTGSPSSQASGARAAVRTKATTKAAEPVIELRPSRTLVFGLSGGVLVFGLAVYAWLGNWAGLSTHPGATPGPVAAGGPNPHEMGPAQIEAIIAKLAQRLQGAPEDVEGWAMLGRSYSALGRHAEGLPAYRRVIELRPNDAAGYADLADAVATVNGKKLDGEPEQLIAKALALDPNNVKALSLSGTVSFIRGDAQAAIKQWERAMQHVEPGSPMSGQLQGALADARRRAGEAAAPPATVQAATPPATVQAAAPTLAPVPAGVAAAAGAGVVRGRVTLSAALKAQASPEDTLYVFARSTQGGKAPLAILRRQVKDLPLDFTLDDSLSMSPAMRLSTAGQVLVGARISKSGNPMSQPGDLQGLSAPVAVGSSGVLVEIGETMR